MQPSIDTGSQKGTTMTKKEKETLMTLITKYANQIMVFDIGTKSLKPLATKGWVAICQNGDALQINSGWEE